MQCLDPIRQKIIPAARRISDLEEMVKYKFEYVVMLQVHLAQLMHVTSMAHTHRKKLILHADLIQGMRSDEHGAQYLCQEIKPDGIISTHSQVLEMAKKRDVLTIQRVFLLDSQSLETSLRVINSVQPDYIELLPGVIPELIKEVYEATHIPIFAGGFIRTPDHVRQALGAGAIAITTSSKNIWKTKI